VGAPGFSTPGYSGDGQVYLILTDTTSPYLPSSTVLGNVGLLNGAALGTSVTYGYTLVNGDSDIVAGAPGGGTSYQNIQIWKYAP
jgi:hypothetical protein